MNLWKEIVTSHLEPAVMSDFEGTDRAAEDLPEGLWQAIGALERPAIAVPVAMDVAILRNAKFAYRSIGI